MGFLGINKRKIEYNNALDAKRLSRSFKAAFEGIASTYKKEQNIKIHTVIALLVVIFGFFLKINYIEWLVCLVLIGFMLMAEFFNTAIEYVVDSISAQMDALIDGVCETPDGTSYKIVETCVPVPVTKEDFNNEKKFPLVFCPMDEDLGFREGVEAEISRYKNLLDDPKKIYCGESKL